MVRVRVPAGADATHSVAANDTAAARPDGTPTPPPGSTLVLDVGGLEMARRTPLWALSSVV